jgi:hypothetical protein
MMSAVATSRKLRVQARGSRWVGRSFRRSFPQAPPSATDPHHLDHGPNLSSEDGTRQDTVDGRGSASHPWVAGSSPASPAFGRRRLGGNLILPWRPPRVVWRFTAASTVRIPASRKPRCRLVAMPYVAAGRMLNLMKRCLGRSQGDTGIDTSTERRGTTFAVTVRPAGEDNKDDHDPRLQHRTVVGHGLLPRLDQQGPASGDDLRRRRHRVRRAHRPHRRRGGVPPSPGAIRPDGDRR